MKKFNFVTLAMFLLCLSCLNIYGKARKEITNEAFSNAYEKVRENTRKLVYRVIWESFIYKEDESKIWYVKKGIHESVSPTKTRSAIEYRNNELNSTSFSELIKIDDVEYRREENGEWTKNNSAQRYGVGVNVLSANDTKYYLTESVKLNNRTADLFEVEGEYNFQIENFINKPKLGNRIYRRYKIWISKDGLLLKIEMEDQNPNPAKTLYRRLLIYEYDPNIKLEAPIK